MWIECFRRQYVSPNTIIAHWLIDFIIVYCFTICFFNIFFFCQIYFALETWFRYLDTLFLGGIAGAAPKAIESVTSLLQHIGGCRSSRGCSRCRWWWWHGQLRLVGITAHSAAWLLCWSQCFAIDTGACGWAAGLPGCVWYSEWQWRGEIVLEIVFCYVT